ncbi:MAG: hypothetical protein ACOX5J_11545 [Candidatus Hydrogenedentales bacterium]
MTQANPEMIAACHVLCPNRPLFLSGPEAYRQYFVEAAQRRHHARILFVQRPRAPARPYGYHRMQAWECWAYEAVGTYFWALSDTGNGSSWNEYTAPGTDYCPFFLDAETVTAGKHMEAIRESIQDFEYLVMLRDAIARAGESDTAAAASVLLAELPGRVLDASRSKTQYWNEPLDRDVADRARLEILDRLMELE